MRITAAALVLAVTGCGFTDEPTRSQDSVPSQSQLLDEGIPRGIEEDYVALARQIPGYGGHFFEDGVLVVYLTGIGSSSQAHPIIEAALAERLSHGGGSIRIEFRSAEFDFLQLARWRGLLPGLLETHPNIYMFGISKSQNRLGIGLRGSEARSFAEAQLRRAGIPLAAVFFEEMEGPPVPH